MRDNTCQYFSRFLFLIMCDCVCLECGFGGSEEAVVSNLTWVLKTELKSSGKAGSTLSCQTVSAASINLNGTQWLAILQTGPSPVFQPL